MTVKIGILTSSRADYSIYFPLIKGLENLPNTSVEIIAFGTHLSEKYGYTVNQILADGFEVQHRIENTFALGGGGRLKFTKRMAIIADYFYNFNEYMMKEDLSFSKEILTLFISPHKNKY